MCDVGEYNVGRLAASSKVNAQTKTAATLCGVT